MIPKNLRYSKDHEWVGKEGELYRIGITQFAQEALGDIVFVELPSPGTRVKGGNPFGVVESVKAVSDLLMPVSGQVVSVNDAVVDTPELVNSDPYGGGWMMEFTPDSPAEVEKLMDADAYARYLEEEA